MADIPNLLIEAADRWPKAEAIVGHQVTLTFEQLRSRVWACCRRLRESDVASGHRVAMLAGTSIETIILLHALQQCGAIACPISTRLPESAIRGLVKMIGASAIIADHSPAGPMTCSILELVDLVCDNGPGSAAGQDLPDCHNDDQDATIVSTSGSSGHPKAALLTVGNHYYSALGANQRIPFEPGDRWALSLPLYHVGGLGILYRSLLGGGTVVIPAGRGQALHDEQRITHQSLVLTQLKRLVAKPSVTQSSTTTLKASLIGGGAVPVSLLVQALTLGIPVRPTYGLTEMASQVATCAANDLPARIATSGSLLTYRELDRSDDGELLVGGPALFRGYVTESGIERPQPEPGRFATGDVGEVDEDGYLTVTGRKDNQFVSGGENIQPETIESCLLSIPEIMSAVVVPIDDPEYGHRPVAFLQPSPGKGIDKRDIRNHLYEFLPKFMCPDRFFRWPEETQTGQLKVGRAVLKEVARELVRRSGR